MNEKPTKNNKICPFSIASTREKLEECLKDRCAIWEIITQTCGLLTLSYIQAYKEGRYE